MTVQDLIEILKKCDRDAEVFIRGDEVEDFSLANHVYQLGEVEIRSLERSPQFQQEQVFLLTEDGDKVGVPCVVMVAMR